MADNAFARCQKFLSYHPLAQWCSIVSSVGSALLYVGLIVLLGVVRLIQQGSLDSLWKSP